MLANAASDSPNIVLVIADDMGYSDLGSYGGEIETPQLDALAENGLRFTNFYVNNMCWPTRASLLTGLYPKSALADGSASRGFHPDLTTLPEALKTAGYSTFMSGKWHLSDPTKPNGPSAPHKRGFDRAYSTYWGTSDFFAPVDLYLNGENRDHEWKNNPDFYYTDSITDYALTFLKDHNAQAKDDPFFLYVSHECPHFPFQGPNDSEKVVNKENWMKPDAGTYVAMLEDLDSEVGRLLAALEKHKLSDNTLVVFASDNGGFSGAANMGPLNGAKSTTLEGGIRVPLIMRWPNKIKPGITSDQVCATFDLTRSILNLAQAKVPEPSCQ